MPNEFFNPYEMMLGLFIFEPIIVLIHELGHAFFNFIFGGKTKKIVIGKGKRLFSIGILEIRRWYFYSGQCSVKSPENDSKPLTIIMLLGGVLFQLFTGIILLLLVKLGIIEHGNWLDVFLSFSFVMAVSAIIPITYPDGMNSDGKQIYQTIRYGTSQLYNNKEEL